MKWRSPEGRRGGAFAHPLLGTPLSVWLLAALGAVTIVLCAYALTGNGAAAGSDETGSFPGRPTSPTGSPAATPVTSLWFGDSIVRGCCRTSSASLNMAQTAAATLGWPEPQVRGFPGTGYVTASKINGVAQPAYRENIGQFLTGAHYRVVVVAGGNNDAAGTFSPALFRAAVRSTLHQVRLALPEAKLVVLGPYSPNGSGYAAQRIIEREEAKAVGAMFIDGVAQGWFLGQQSLISKDGFSPNDAGQAYLGVRVAAELKRLALS